MIWRYRFVSDCSEGELAAVYHTLSPSRKAHIDRMALPRDQQRSLAGEWLARQLLQELGIARPLLHRAESGLPYVEGQAVHVSIAHCDDLVVCAADTAPVGIDAEMPRPIEPGMVSLVCTPEEAAYVGSDPTRFFEIWTGKEAWFKKQGTGITDFQRVNVLSLPRQLFCIGKYLVQIV